MSRSPNTDTSKTRLDEYVAGWEAAFRLLREGRSWSGNERNNAFLNCGGQGFADASAATGLDFADDGRAFSVVDWDADGDLDLWLYNRTGPRLRLMINRDEGRGGASSVAFRLRGTRSNRDGVGARVEIRLKNQPDVKLIETLYAGDGYLSQSSKWLHFGLGRDPEIEQVLVRWPGGVSETFSEVSPDGRYVLEEGTGKAVAEKARRAASNLEPSSQAAAETSTGSRLYLPMRVPMPELPYVWLNETDEDTRDQAGQLVGATSGPVLLNIWASWCLPCMAELEELTERAMEVRAAGFDILAITVDGLDSDQGTSPADARRQLDRINFPFRAGVATPEMLEKIELIEDFVYDRKFPFGVPVSFLLDGKGRLAATYRGRLDLDVVLEDARGLNGSIQDQHDRSAPLPGRWQAQLPDVDLTWMASKFKHAFPRDAERFLELALEQGAESAGILLDLAETSFRRGLEDRSLSFLRRAIELDGDSLPAHKNMAQIFRESGRPNEALRHYKHLLRIAPDDAEVRYGVGMALLQVEDVSNAFGHLEIASRLDPDNPEPILAMIGILVTFSDPADPRPVQEAIRWAEDWARRTGYQDPRILGALAEAYAAARRFTDATRVARDGLELARALGDNELVAQLTSRLNFYEKGQLPGR